MRIPALRDRLLCHLLLYCTLNYSAVHALIAFQHPALTIHHLPR